MGAEVKCKIDEKDLQYRTVPCMINCFHLNIPNGYRLFINANHLQLFTSLSCWLTRVKTMVNLKLKDKHAML